MPGVALPWFIWVTRRTLSSAFALLCSISRCSDLTRVRSPFLDARKMRCLRCLTVRQTRFQSMACQSTASPEVTFAARCIELFLPVAVPLQRLLGRSPGARQHPFELRHRALSGRLWFPHAFRRPAFASCAFLRPLWVSPALTRGLLARARPQ